ncbi:hypothetical protein GCM10010478_61010 [Streptomyces erythrogriseus]|uniref:Uncharacterized protein n=1 Tax=Streptomyces erythrogriseus TaxID=284027 RepID=A0ABP6JZ11_9ACTN
MHDECGGVLVFRSENQGCAFWGVRLGDLDQDDPPVFVQARHGWVPFLDRVSLACIELVLSETLFGGGGRLYNACELPADLLEAVPERFKRVALPDVDGAGGLSSALVLRPGAIATPGRLGRPQLVARSGPDPGGSGGDLRDRPRAVVPGIHRVAGCRTAAF